MIYIFKGCGEICKLPCTICQGLCKGFDKVCKGCSEAFGEICAPISQVCDKPLGGYVILTWLTMAVALGCSVGGFSCEGSQAKLLCIVDIGISLVHAGFAYYLQWRLCSGLEKRGKSEGSHREIVKEAKEIMKYDVAFCLYFFVFFGSLAYNCYALTFAGGCGGTDLPVAAAVLMIIFGACMGNYAFCWYCGQCCYAGANYSKRKGTPATAKHDVAQPPAQQVPEPSGAGQQAHGDVPAV
mmetsp:Transcript_90151/g.255517  ORF Transcript_90151/g.255517 Transcript_90151/m.255517 type:complete len:240 (-) Transcript_90151:374-1093(-)